MTKTFATGLKRRPVVRADGTVVSVTVPVDFPPVIEADGERFHFAGYGHCRQDGTPAGLYANDFNDELWFNEGKGYYA
jgi:hypothetical protein